jgi:hypothetical protein
MGPQYVVLLNAYKTGVLGDVTVYGPFDEREDAEALVATLKQRDRDADVEIESILSPAALR